MRKTIRRNGKDNRPFVKSVFLLLVMALLAGILMYFAWCSYEEKMEILYVTLEQQSSGTASVDIVTGLLKGEIVTDVSDAEQQLAQYGFLKSYENHYKKSLYGSWTVISVIFCLLYVGFLTFLYWMDQRQRLLRKKELLWLQRQVTVLRDRASESFQHSEENVAANVGTVLSDDCFTAGQTDNKMTQMSFDRNRTKTVIWQEQDENLGSGYLDDRQSILEKYDEDLGRFLLEFAALADSIALFCRQAGIEREETKALVTDISHQLKTPIAALRTSFEILQSGGLSEAEYQEFLERCSIQVLRLEELIAALVNISRMETGMIAIKKVERNLFDTILLAVNRIYPKSEEKGISIELEAEEELRQVKVLHDPKWLCEAFLNVLENAVKYSAGQTKITIRMIRMNVYLRIEIEDEGIGIPRKEWNRIFQRFYRGGAHEVQEASGSGVGLYLAREIVTRHEGTLVVSASRHQKQGSCFVFQIPCL